MAFRLQAACEALLALLESKRPKEERGELMHVFGGMWQLHGAASQACESENEADYMFLKRITQALCVLGQLLCEHVHDPAAAPPNVDLYVHGATPLMPVPCVIKRPCASQVYADDADAHGAHVASCSVDYAAVLDCIDREGQSAAHCSGGCARLPNSPGQSPPSHCEGASV